MSQEEFTWRWHQCGNRHETRALWVVIPLIVVVSIGLTALAFSVSRWALLGALPLAVATGLGMLKWVDYRSRPARQALVREFADQCGVDAEDIVAKV